MPPVKDKEAKSLLSFNKCQNKDIKIRKNSISSLEELNMYKNEKGIENVRSMAIKESFALDGLKNSIRLITLDDNAKADDGYYYKRMNSIWNELEGDFIIMGGYRG